MKPHTLRSLALAVASLLALDNPLAAQDEPSPIASGVRAPIMIGPSLGFGRNFHTGGFRTITSDESCPVFESGGGWGFMIGGNVEIALAPESAIIARLGYESRPGTFESELPPSFVLQPGSNEAVPQSLIARSEIGYSLLSIDALFKQELATAGPMRIGVVAGPTVGIVLGGTNRQYEDLIAPENSRFQNPNNYPLENDGRRLIIFDGDIAERNGVRVSLKAGVQGELGVFGNAWLFAPGLYYDFGLTDVTTAENWQVSSLVLGLDFRRAF